MMLVISQTGDKLSKDEILLDFVKVDMPNSINNVYTTKVVDAWLKDIANKPVTITDRSTGEIKVIGKALCGFKDKDGFIYGFDAMSFYQLIFVNKIGSF